MEDNLKSRGRKHRTNKNKYKPGGAHVPPHKPKLESNWDRYEQETESKSNTNDFSILANAPISHGSHFQFKSDKNIALEIKEASELFNLDLTLLDKSLGTIPFHLRSGIGDDDFTEDQRVEDNTNEYLNYIKGYHLRQTRPVFGSDDEQTSPTQESSKLIVSQQSPEAPKTNEDDLEAWLEQVLDN